MTHRRLAWASDTEEIAALRSALAYDPDNGTFTWKVNRQRARAGEPAGWIWRSRLGAEYLSIEFGGRTYQAHRVAFALIRGTWPDELIDHADGDGSNNKWSNLRPASRLDNARNRKLSKSNSSGFKGVSFHRQVGRFRADIRVNGKLVFLGLYDRPEAAHAAYCKAAEQHFGEFARQR